MRLTFEAGVSVYELWEELTSYNLALPHMGGPDSANFGIYYINYI